MLPAGAEAAGLLVVQDRCTKTEHRRMQAQRLGSRRRPLAHGTLSLPLAPLHYCAACQAATIALHDYLPL